MEEYCSMKAVVVGGGVAGLTLAYLLSRKGFNVSVLEKENRVGGLARSFHYEGWSVDIGPHRFHTDDPVVQNFILEIMEGRTIEIPRNSKVFFCDVHFDWPLRLGSLWKLPTELKLRALLDLLSRPPIKDDSYESYVLNRYGKTLTNQFFREYNQKFLKIDLKDCHRDWAETGINRATIDKDVRSSSIVELLLGMLSLKHVDTKFLYPKDGAIDAFSEKLKYLIERHGGKVELGARIRNGTINNGEITTLESLDGRRWDADFVFWTGDVRDLEQLLGCEPSELNYNSTVLCNLLVEGTPPVPSQWEYFGSSSFIFSRTSINIYFNPCLAPKGFYGICAELVCYEEDFVWKKAETLLNAIIQNLIHAKIVRNFNSIMEIHFERVSNTYPIYMIDYPTRLDRYKSKLQRIKNLLACGRTGGFWYNNMDYSIRSSMDIANMIDEEIFPRSRSLPVDGVYRGDF
jgi:protoporphyrinogen oxidase